MYQIRKYKLPIENEVSIEMPTGATILCVQAQLKIGQIWAIVPIVPVAKNAPTSVRIFKTIGTGHTIKYNDLIHMKYIGTYQAEGFVWHVFEKTGFV